MKKHLCIGLFVSVLVSASILFVHAQGIGFMNPVYEILDDAVPVLVEQPSSFAWRWYNGSLQRQNGFGTWHDVDSGTGMAQLFNDYDIATIADVQAAAMTISDMVSALQTYFSSGSPFVSQSGGQNLPQILQTTRQAIGSFPYTATWYQSGGTGNVNSISVSSLTDLVNRALRILSYNQVAASGLPILRNDGSIVSSSVAWNDANVSMQGFAGLAQRLSGQTGSAQFDIFALGSGTSRQVSTLMDALSAMNTSNISALTMSNGNVLYPDGVTQSITGRLSLANINDYGFQGLATILRGASSNGVGIEWMDYTDLSTSTSGYSYLFELNAAGFQNIQNLLAKYMYSHGTDLDIKERENMQPQADQFVEDFTSPSGKGTMSTGNMSDMANVSSSMGDNFKSDATVSDVFTQLGDGDNYSFFSSEVLSDLEGQVPSTFSTYDDGYIDFLSPHLDQFREVVGSSW